MKLLDETKESRVGQARGRFIEQEIAPSWPGMGLGKRISVIIETIKALPRRARQSLVGDKPLYSEWSDVDRY